MYKYCIIYIIYLNIKIDKKGEAIWLKDRNYFDLIKSTVMGVLQSH